MADGQKDNSENETILMALDQINQTIEVMTSVVGRLRTYVEKRESDASAEQSKESPAELPGERILH